jgi:hypothetical protein
VETCEKWPRPFVVLQGTRSYLFWSLMVLETFLMVQNVPNGHIYIDFMKQYIPTLKCLIFEKIAKN